MTPRNERRVALGFKRSPRLPNDASEGFNSIDYRLLMGNEACNEIIADAYILINQGKHNEGADRKTSERWNTK